MITINLLPESFRKPKESSVQQFHRSPLAILLAAVLVAVLVMLGVVWKVHQSALAKLQGRLASIQTQKQAVDTLKASLDALRQEDAVFQQLHQQRVRWAKVLNTLSNVTPENVWFTDLSYDAHGVVVQGSAIAQGGEEMVRIGRFVQDLKANPDVAAVIQDIQIESIKTLQDHDIEIIEFTLSCKFAGKPTS